MLRKFHFLLLILLLSSIFCLTNTFANEDGGLADDIVIPEGIFDYPLIEGPERIEGIPEFHRDPEAIFGSTDFEKMRDFPTDSQEYQLGRKVSWILIFDRITDELLTACTGFLVGPDLLMTNAHCLYDLRSGRLQVGRALILMDYYQDLTVDRTAGGVTTSVRTILAGDGPKDYALLRLNDSIGNTYGWLELDTTTRVNTSQSVKIIQHPDGRSKEISRRNSQISDLLPDRRATRPFLLLYFADTEGGSSGSPVFLRDGTGVIAIHHSAQLNPQTRVPIVNGGSLMSHIVPEIQQYLPRRSITFTPSTIADQTFTVGTAVSLTLPVATGGTAPYTYTLSPIPAGLSFNPTTRILSGTPTTAGTTSATYTATDAANGSASLTFTIEVTTGPGGGAVDVNADGQVTVIDLAIVALFYGTEVAAGVDLPADVNDDGTVNILDLTAVAQAIDAAGNSSALPADDVAAVLEAIADVEAIPEAPATLRFSTSRHTLLSGVAYRNIAAAFADAKHLATEDARLGKWMPMLKELLHLLTEMREIPDTTALLPNYPNPFNPETWIPYQLAKSAEVTLTIYAANGQVVRVLALGHQVAGMYQSRSRAAYWDGRNAVGESVASGLYFYTLTAGDFTATRKMLIAK